MGKFKFYNAKQAPTIKIDVNQVIPSHHPVRFIEQVVSGLDLSSIESKYSEKGQGAFHPSMMLSILFLGYMSGIRSGGALSKACQEDLLFIYISRAYTPSKTTINDFRLANYKYFEFYFVQILELCQQAGIADASLSIYDGTKIEANSSKYQTREKATYQRWLEYLQTDINEIEQELAKLIDQAGSDSTLAAPSKVLAQKKSYNQK